MTRIAELKAQDHGPSNLLCSPVLHFLYIQTGSYDKGHGSQDIRSDCCLKRFVDEGLFLEIVLGYKHRRRYVMILG
jgi:hypothetical protein